MRWIDRYVGAGICLLLAAFESVIPRRSRPISRPVQRIVIFKFFGIGSIVFLTPLFRALRKTYPSSRLTFVTFESNRRLAELFHLADQVITVRIGGPALFVKDVAKLVWILARTRYDMAVDAEFFSRLSVILAYLSRAPIRVGYYSPGMCRNALLTERAYYNHYRHITEVFLALARADSADEGNGEPSPLKLPSEISEMDIGFRPARPFIAINVNTSELCLERRWPASSFVELSVRLLKIYDDMDLVFVGDATERSYVEDIVARISDDRVINLAGRTSFDQLLAVLQRAALVVSNDSGPLHLACALGTPTVGLFGPETPLLYGPKSLNNITLYRGIYCSPCLNVYNSKTAPCGGDNQCMKQITVDEVLDAMARSLPTRATN